MNTFTIKDFVAYNNPCRICNNKVSLSLIPVKCNDLDYSDGITPIFKEKSLYFDLWVKYKEKLAIMINPVNNQFSLKGESDNISMLMDEYKSENHLMFNITCNNCKTQIFSDYIEFKHNYIKPLKLFRERLLIKTENYFYKIESYYNIDKSTIMAEKNIEDYTPPFVLEIPLLPLSKIKTRENIIKKIKLYMVLS